MEVVHCPFDLIVTCFEHRFNIALCVHLFQLPTICNPELKKAQDKMNKQHIAPTLLRPFSSPSIPTVSAAPRLLPRANGLLVLGGALFGIEKGRASAEDFGPCWSVKCAAVVGPVKLQPVRGRVSTWSRGVCDTRHIRPHTSPPHSPHTAAYVTPRRRRSSRVERWELRMMMCARESR